MSQNPPSGSQLLQPSTTAASDPNGAQPQGTVNSPNNHPEPQMQSLVCASPADGGRLPVWEYEIGDKAYYHPLSSFTPMYEGSWEKENILSVFGETKIAVFTWEQLEDHPEWLQGLKTVLDGATNPALSTLEDFPFDRTEDVRSDRRPALPAASHTPFSSGFQLSTATRTGPRGRAKVTDRIEDVRSDRRPALPITSNTAFPSSSQLSTATRTDPSTRTRMTDQIEDVRSDRRPALSTTSQTAFPSGSQLSTAMRTGPGSKARITDQIEDVGGDRRPALPSTSHTAFPSGSQLSTATRIDPRSGAKVTGQHIEGASKRTISEVETECYTNTKRLKQSHQSSEQHMRTKKSHSSEQVSLSDSASSIMNPYSTNAFQTLPSNQSYYYINVESQQPESDDGPQYLDIDDFLASVQREAGVSVTSGVGAGYSNHVQSRAANEAAYQMYIPPSIAQEDVHPQQPGPGDFYPATTVSWPEAASEMYHPRWIAQESSHRQQARLGTSYGPATVFWPSSGQNIHTAEAFPMHHAANSSQGAYHPPMLNQHEAAQLSRFSGAPGHSSPMVTGCENHAYGAESSRVLPDHDTWSRYLSPEGIADLFVPGWQNWEPYFPPGVILSLFSSKAE